MCLVNFSCNGLKKRKHLEKFANIEQFFIQSEKRAFLMARLSTNDEDAALDIVQDAMIKLVSKYLNKQSHEWPPLFYRILQNKINDWHRREKLKKRWFAFTGKTKVNDADEINFNQISIENAHAGESKSPELQAIGQEFSQSLQSAVTQLPKRQQQAFTLRAIEQFSTKETSDIMKCSEGSVKTHYSRAMHSLRQTLKAFS